MYIDTNTVFLYQYIEPNNMNKEIIKNIIREKQQEIAEIQFIKRDCFIEPSVNYVFVGMRRAGKSYLMYQQIHELIRQNEHTIHDILFINFEDERIRGIKAEELSLILDAYKEMYHDFKPILFLDEIQNVEGWEKFARRLADSKYRVYISGSNANMLSREIYTTLGGRFVAREIFPFSFDEYLKYNKVVLDKNWQYGNERTLAVNYFDKYFNFGGIAEVFPLFDKRDYLNSLYHKILLGDIIARNDIRNENAIRVLVKKIAETVMHPVSLQKLKNIVDATGSSIAKNTLIDYLTHLKDAYLIFEISNFSDKFTERETIKKRYFFDNGLLNLFLIDANTRLLENLAALTLKKKFADDVFYYNKNVEVDFYIPKEKIGIQVSYSIADFDTREREVDALLKLNKAFGLEKLQIITYNEEEIINIQDLKIYVIPIWKWMIEQSFAPPLLQ